jgi:guanine nucleotide-binding protein G(I)/G(S)/G(T) subunit beta-1
MAEVDIEQELAKCRETCKNLVIQLKESLENAPDTLCEVGTRSAFRTERLHLRCIRTLKGHYGKVFDLDWFPNSEDMLSVSQDGKIMVWDALTGHKKLAIPLRSAWIMTCTVSPSGCLVAAGGLDNLCSIYRVENARGWETQNAFRELQQHEGYLSRCRFVDDNTIITSSGDATCVLWDVESRTAKHTFTDHSGDVMSISVLKDHSSIFVSGSVDATAKIWDWRVGTSAISNFTGHESDINDVKWFPDGKAFVSGSDDSSCRLFDTRCHRQLNCYRSDRIFCGVTGVDFSKSGSHLFASYDDTPFCAIWDAVDSQEDINELSHELRVSNIMVSPNGNAVATACWDYFLRIWA